MKKTKIICTIGPSCDSEEQIKGLIEKGMDIARLNLSHNTHAYHEGAINKIRKVAEEMDKPVAIIIDLQGPKLRLASLDEKITINARSTIVLSSSYTKISDDFIKIPLLYTDLYKYVKIKDRIILGDNQVELVVQEIQGKDIICLSLEQGILRSGMGVNVSNNDFVLPSPTKKDLIDIKFAVANNVDFIALSFVMSHKDLISLRRIIQEEQGKDSYEQIKIIAKIEKEIAVKNIDRIIDESDAIMIARGDLGIEMPIEQVPLIQKSIIKKCVNKAKPVIVATQMLLSMKDKLSPTRAEVSDIANAVIDQADALMLSEETSIGKHPQRAIKVMSEIIVHTEKFEDDQFFNRLPLNEEKRDMSIDDSLIFSLNLISQKIKAKLMLVISLSGYTGRVVSKFRLKFPVFVFTCNKKIARQLNLHWGLFPLASSNEELCNPSKDIKLETIEHLLKSKVLKKGDTILIAGRKNREHLNSFDWIEIEHI